MTAAEADLRGRLLELVATWCDLDPAELDADASLGDLGLSSRDIVALSGEIGDELGVDLPTTVLWESPTISTLISTLAPEAAGVAAPRDAVPAPDEPLALVGLGCRLPGGVDCPEAFWELLARGGDAVGTVPAGRWSDRPADVGDRGGFLDDVAGFDAGFFGISPREAAAADPQQRLLLEVAHEALAHAAIDPASLRGSATGVYVGVSSVDYPSTPGEPWQATGTSAAVVAGRLGYVLDLRGPAVTVDTACSSSLVALHQAAQALRAGEIDLALVGGTNVLGTARGQVAMEALGVLSPRGRCAPFDAAADGVARGEGAGVVVLKRLADARRDGDRVLALLAATAVNADGHSQGLTAPHPGAQRDLLAAAYRRAGIDPATVDYVEAHGTGTALGDPIEAGALGAALGAGRSPEHPLLIGSVKSNIGHTEAAAGLVGLIKVVLAMGYDRLPATLHQDEPSPHLDLAAAGLRVVAHPTGWPRYGGRASAGVSSFGFSGTNAHAVLVEAPAYPAAEAPRDRPVVAVLSAPDEERLQETARALGRWLTERPAGARPSPVDVAHTLARRDAISAHTGRRRRLAVVASDHEELAARLTGAAHGPVAEPDPTAAPGVVWLFGGHGSWWPGTGRGLLDGEPVFAAAVARLDESFTRYAGRSLTALLTDPPAESDLAATQLAVCGVQLALAATWRAAGVQPAAVVGHSMGEVAAAVAAGVLTEDAGVRVMAVRARRLAELDAAGGGAMASVELTPAELASIGDEVEVAVHAAPDQLTVSGPAAAVHRVVEAARDRGRTARLLPLGVACHTAAVEPLRAALRRELADLETRPATVPWYDTTGGDPRRHPTGDAAHWADAARHPVRWADAVAAAAADGHARFLELSPHPVVLGATGRTLAAAGTEPVLVSSVRRGDDEVRALRIAQAQLHVAGVAVDWAAVLGDGRVVDLPGPVWRHERFWAEPPAAVAAPTGAHPLLGAHQELPGGSADVWQAPPRHGDLTTARLRERVLAAAEHRHGPGAALVGELVRLTEPGTGQAGRGAALSTLARGDGTVEVHLRTPDGGWVPVATARTTAVTPGPDDGGSPETAAEASGTGTRLDAVRRLTADVLGLDHRRLDVDADLAAVGLDSLGALRLRRLLEAELDVTVPVRELLAGATVRQLAQDPGPGRPAPTRGAPARVSVPADTPAVTVLQEGEPGVVPLHLFHPAGTPTAVYGPLVAALPPDVPCLGHERAAEPGPVPERARGHLAQLRRLQPAGPYRLLGWSFGGVLAQETAVALTAAGQQVEIVALVDAVRAAAAPGPDLSGDPRSFTAARLSRLVRHLENVHDTVLPIDLDGLADLDEDAQLARLLRALTQAPVPWSAAALEHQRTSILDARDAEAHVPGRLSAPVVQYRALHPCEAFDVLDPRYNRVGPDGGWGDALTDLEIVGLETDHLGVLDPPHAQAIAHDLAARWGLMAGRSR
ncbi:type I polyketide synthase [Actinomycetospora sp. TBRC 11914]|uniref:type I polyketide synthase n=1 Tax=Actinomycetospora sp. TBRC 11914 TaxID=2729387 RepID=UPI00145ED7AD|nr:type I polyketide synthase [Actinomycetospora sp. TBRC 11914]NMO89028.1 acyltransferase domain-containing protein [Actinomycetospora sp. TBRC 11914]